MHPRVIHIIETAEPGGAENILVQVADGLREEYDPVGVVLQRGWTSGELERLNIPVVHMPLARSFDLTWVWRMTAYIRKNNIKLIHAHEFTSNCYALLAARLAGIPIICTVHGKNYYPDRYYRRFAYRRVARFADAFVVVSKDLGEFVVSRIGIDPSLVKVVHNGIDTRVFSSRPETRSRVREMLDIPADTFVIIVVSALFEMKGIQDLVAALRMPGAASGELQVLLVGDGNYKAELQRRVTESGLERVVRFLGFRSDVADLLAAADLFVLPSYSEGLPVSVLEAMAAGLAVIATDVGGLKEIIRDGENAFLVPPASPGALAGAIGFCLENRAAIEEIRKQARKDVVEAFDLDAMLDNYRGLYGRLLAH